MELKNNTFYLVTVLVLLAFTVFPMMKGISPTGIVIPRVLILVLSAIYVVDCFGTKSMIWLYLFFLITLFFHWNSDFATVVGVFMEFSIPFILSDYLIKTQNQKERRIFFLFSMSIIIITIITSTIALLFVDPDAIRRMVEFSNYNQMDMTRRYHMIGVCDYDFAAMCMCVPVVFIYLYKTTSLFRTRILLTFVILLSLFFMFKANVTTTLIICVFITVCALIIRPFSSRFGNVFLLSMGFVLLLSIDVLEIYDVIAPYLVDTGMEFRIGGLMGQEDNSDWETRIGLYQTSWEVFKNNILIGSTEDVIGGHSYFIDRLAMYGIIGIVPFAAMILTQYKRVVSQLNKYQAIIYKLCWVGLIVLGFLKNMSGICYWLFIFVLIPAILLYNGKTPRN